MTDNALLEAIFEAKRFLVRAEALKACRKPQTAAERAERERGVCDVRVPHGWMGCPESSAARRASMDLTRALARLRR